MGGRLDPARIGRLKPWFIGWRCSDEMMGRLRALQERLGVPTTTAVMERAVEALEREQRAPARTPCEHEWTAFVGGWGGDNPPAYTCRKCGGTK